MNYFQSNWYSTIKTARYYLLTLLRVSNTAHLPTKPDQVAKAARLEGKPKSNIKSSTSPNAPPSPLPPNKYILKHLYLKLILQTIFLFVFCNQHLDTEKKTKLHVFLKESSTIRQSKWLIHVTPMFHLRKNSSTGFFSHILLVKTNYLVSQ